MGIGIGDDRKNIIEWLSENIWRVAIEEEYIDVKSEVPMLYWMLLILQSVCPGTVW
jgi:hypothetical protein